MITLPDVFTLGGCDARYMGAVNNGIMLESIHSPRGQLWNKLSTDCVDAISVNKFNNRIDKYLVKTLRIECGLSIIQWRPCLLPPKVLLG